MPRDLAAGSLIGPCPMRLPAEPARSESRYLQQLFDAYGDHKMMPIKDLDGLGPWPDLVKHYHRQREVFYHAETLCGISPATRFRPVRSKSFRTKFTPEWWSLRHHPIPTPLLALTR